jgi:hypothetical protein
MKGTTKLLRQLELGEVVPVSGETRANIYMLAKRIGVRVSVLKFAGGFYVTRIPFEKTPFGVDLDKALTPEMSKQEKLAELRQIMSGKTFLEIPEPPDEVSDDWIEAPVTFENGEILYWHHKPKQRPECYHRESDLSAA